MAIIDVITYNGEADLLELRFKILEKAVDKFIVVEFGKTFSGKEKPSYWAEYEGYKPANVDYYCYTDLAYEKYRDLAESSPNTHGAEHWKREFMQKECLKDALEASGAQDNDLVFVGDCDEIWDPAGKDGWVKFTGSPFKLELIVYTYYLNNRSSERFYGTLCSKYFWIRHECLNHLRTNSWKTNFRSGWHFTSLAPYLRQKLGDSYTDESYATDHVMDHLDENIAQDKDFLGRPFSYKVDESDWPQYLKDHREKYKHLLK